METLTPRQREVLQVIEAFFARHGFPPAQAEIAGTLGFRSVSAVAGHLRALARKGYIALHPGASRGIRLLVSGSGQRWMASAGGEAFMAPVESGDGGGVPSIEREATPASLPQAVDPCRESFGSYDPPGPGGLNPVGRTLPVVGRVAAGSPILAAANVERRVALDPSVFAPAAHYLLRVRGLSMRDEGILEDDLIAVHRTSDLREGAIMVVRIDDEVTVKRIRRDGEHLLLISANPDYALRRVGWRDGSVHLEGLVVGLLRL